MATTGHRSCQVESCPNQPNVYSGMPILHFEYKQMDINNP
jgi:hypothetical protein